MAYRDGHFHTREQQQKQYSYVVQLNKILYITRICIGKLRKVMMEYRITSTKTQGQLQWDPPPEIFEGYISEDGKPYFHNTLTNETVWEVRDEVRDYLASKNNADVAAEIAPSLDDKQAKLNNDVFQNGDRLRQLVRDYVKNKFNVEAERSSRTDLLISIGEIYPMPLHKIAVYDEMTRKEKNDSTHASSGEGQPKFNN